MIDKFEPFLNQVRARLEFGEKAYGSSGERTSSELISEIQQELADICGWSAVLWARLEKLRAKTSELEPDKKFIRRMGDEFPSVVE